MGHLLKGKDCKTVALDGKQYDKFFLVRGYANVEQPEDNFIQAGADVITSNKVASTSWALRPVGMKQDFLPLVEVLSIHSIIHSKALLLICTTCALSRLTSAKTTHCQACMY